MSHRIFIEPDTSTSAGRYRSAGVTLDRLRCSILNLPGVEKIYPRSPYVLRAMRTTQSRSHATSEAPEGSQNHTSNSSDDTLIQGTGGADLTVAVRIGAAPGVHVPTLAREVGALLARELPAAAIEVEIVSC